jgi:hypothetical protein
MIDLAEEGSLSGWWRRGRRRGRLMMPVVPVVMALVFVVMVLVLVVMIPVLVVTALVLMVTLGLAVFPVGKMAPSVVVPVIIPIGEGAFVIAKAPRVLVAVELAAKFILVRPAAFAP